MAIYYKATSKLNGGEFDVKTTRISTCTSELVRRKIEEKHRQQQQPQQHKKFTWQLAFPKIYLKKNAHRVVRCWIPEKSRIKKKNPDEMGANQLRVILTPVLFFF